MVALEETECEQELCQCLLTGLVKLGVASDETEAQSMYDATAGSDMPSETLSVHSTGGSIRYGTGYTEFYQIRSCDILSSREMFSIQNELPLQRSSLMA